MDKVYYTGYLRREMPSENMASTLLRVSLPSPYVLVTPGGGGDGETLIDWVLRAYETEGDLGNDALIVFGPFMSEQARAGFLRRIQRLDKVQAITFDTHVEHLLAKSAGVITMGGYNTFCEILTLDKKGIIVPRAAPKIEQLLRGQSAERLGLTKLLSIDGPTHPAVMADAIRGLEIQQPPSHVDIPGLLDGIDNVNRMVDTILRQRPKQVSAS